MNKHTGHTLLLLLAFLFGGVQSSQAVKTIKGKKYFSYMVQTGETLDALSNAFKVSQEELEEQNPSIKQSGLKEGTIILVPVKESMLDENLPEISLITYKVKPGDTLFSLAKNNNSTIEDIIQRNAEQLGDGILIAGSTIKIAKNSGGLTGGEDKLQERKKQAELLAKQRQQAIQDSINKSKINYWVDPWTIIDVQNAGSIDTLRSELEWRAISRLKVTGNANLIDLAVVGKRIFEFDRISALDLHDAKNIVKVSSKTFEECSSLKAISLPNSIDSIGANSFTGCNSQLEVLRCYAVNPPKVEALSFNGINLANCTLEVPQSALSAYKASENWNKFSKIEVIPTISTGK